MMMRESQGVAVAGLHQNVRIIISAKHWFQSSSIVKDDWQAGLIAPTGSRPRRRNGIRQSAIVISVMRLGSMTTRVGGAEQPTMLTW
jgi:hypothetical protein